MEIGTCSTCTHWEAKRRSRDASAECREIVDMVGLTVFTPEALATSRDFGCALYSNPRAPKPLGTTPRARTSDPTTSHEAARSITNLTDRRAGVLVFLYERPDLPDVDLVLHYEGRTAGPAQSASGLRSRRAELVRMGLVEEKGETTIDGRKHKVWGLTDAGVQRAREITGDA